MRQQKRPFTVTVKRRKGASPKAGTAFGGFSSFAEEAARIAAEDGESRNWSEDGSDLNAISSGSTVSKKATKTSAKTRAPRILDMPAPDNGDTPAADAGEDGPPPPPRRARPGRPRKSRTQGPAAAATDRGDERDAPSAPTAGEPRSETADNPQGVEDDHLSHAGTAASAVSAHAIGEEAVFDEPAETPQEAEEPPRYRRRRWRLRRGEAAPPTFKRGEGWKRHLPRWKR